MRKNVLCGGRAGVALAVSTLLMAACGGGGGGDDDGPPRVEVPATVRTVPASAGSDANPQNMPTLGGWLARSVMSVSGDGAFDITGLREGPQARSSAALGSAALLHARVTRAAMRLGLRATRERPAAVSTETIPCANIDGSLTFTIDDADNDEKLSAGDSVSLAATNCVLEAGLPTANGNLRLDVNAVELDADEVPSALDASATFNGFSVAEYGTYDGQMRLWTRPEGAGERSRLSYRDTTVTFEGGSVVFDFDIYGFGDATTSTFDINGGIGIDGQTYSIVSQGVMTANGANPPASGTTQLRDTAGDAVRLTARSVTSFDLEFLPAGAAQPTASLTGLAWEDYLDLP